MSYFFKQIMAVVGASWAVRRYIAPLHFGGPEFESWLVDLFLSFPHYPSHLISCQYLLFYPNKKAKLAKNQSLQ